MTANHFAASILWHFFSVFSLSHKFNDIFWYKTIDLRYVCNLILLLGKNLAFVWCARGVAGLNRISMRRLMLSACWNTTSRIFSWMASSCAPSNGMRMYGNLYRERQYSWTASIESFFQCRPSGMWKFHAKALTWESKSGELCSDFREYSRLIFLKFLFF